MSSLVTSASFKYEILGSFAECDLVAVVGKYSQSGVIVDMFRVKDNKIIEHWDSDSNQAAPDFNAPTSTFGDHNGARKLEVINELYTLGLFTNSPSIIDTFFDPKASTHRGTYGQSGFSEYLTKNKIRYSKIHHMISDSEFNTVFVMAEGTINGKGYAFYDFYRMSLESIEEHWDSRRSIPTSTASGLPIF
jgi:predicted SnoaL-like aldol condensation-catalyzing enzyme